MGTNKFSLEGQTAIVTGSGSGIGKGIALAYVELGAGIVVAEMNAESAETTAAEIREMGGKAIVVPTDVRDSAQVASMVKAALDEFGQIDILVNNAGGMFRADVATISEGGFDAIVRVNLKSTFLCSKAVSAVMMEKKAGGCIINIASVNGLSGTPGSAAYGASKAAIINFTQSLAMELAHHQIRVNAIAPGVIATPGTEQWTTPESAAAAAESIPLSRRGKPEDIAGAAVYLASAYAEWVTGQTIVVDGGSTAQSHLP